MNLNDLKYYWHEIAFALLMVLLLGCWGGLYVAYTNIWVLESQITQLQSNFEVTELQMRDYDDLSKEEQIEWYQLKKAFYTHFPNESPFPQRLTYNAIEKTYKGSQIPVKSHALFIYNLIYRIAEKYSIDEITIGVENDIRGPKLKEVSPFVKGMYLEFRFSAIYKDAVQFIDALQKLPVMFKVEKAEFQEENSRQKARIQVKLLTRFLYRTSDSNL